MASLVLVLLVARGRSDLSPSAYPPAPGPYHSPAPAYAPSPYPPAPVYPAKPDPYHHSSPVHKKPHLPKPSPYKPAVSGHKAYKPDPYRPAPVYKSPVVHKPTGHYAPTPVYKPAPTPVYKPAPAPAYKPAPTPVYKPAPTPVYKPAPTPVYKPAPDYHPPVVAAYKPAPSYHPPAPVHKAAPYHAAPAHKAAPYHPPAAPAYKEPAKPYAYEYAVADDYSKAAFNAHETSDGEAVKGSYSVALPDGRTQHVKYTADHYNGYVAEVTYEGTAHYPQGVPSPHHHKPKGPYKAAAVVTPAPYHHPPSPPLYTPAPVYHG